ncbi:hypothetical protein [Providencia sp. PROV130]|uniref:hypothetical protein n=1 Tax=Providencia sp. PROV130 TaxID=2949840 RepID=UPI00234B054A|nr:hypothetical protein [Providencia sp. PROV130]
MSAKTLDPFKPVHEQLDIAIPNLLDSKSILDEVLPFYIAFAAKTSKDPELFYPLIIKCLEVVYSSENSLKDKKEKDIAEYAYSLQIKSKEIFNKIKDIK